MTMCGLCHVLTGLVEVGVAFNRELVILPYNYLMGNLHSFYL